jgi:hypothetical protein
MRSGRWLPVYAGGRRHHRRSGGHAGAVPCAWLHLAVRPHAAVNGRCCCRCCCGGSLAVDLQPAAVSTHASRLHLLCARLTAATRVCVSCEASTRPSGISVAVLLQRIQRGGCRVLLRVCVCTIDCHNLCLLCRRLCIALRPLERCVAGVRCAADRCACGRNLSSHLRTQGLPQQTWAAGCVCGCHVLCSRCRTLRVHASVRQSVTACKSCRAVLSRQQRRWLRSLLHVLACRRLLAVGRDVLLLRQCRLQRCWRWLRSSALRLAWRLLG